MNEPRATVTDGELLRRVLERGDERAFDALFDRHSPALSRFLRYVLGAQAADVDDVLQETWLAAVRGLPRFRGEAAFRTWLLGIGARLARRHTARLRPFEELDERAPGRQTNVADRIDLERAIAQLSPRARLVFVMHDLYGFTHEEIGAALRVASGTSKSQLSYARRALRAAPLEEPVPAATKQATVGMLRAHGLLRMRQPAWQPRAVAAAAVLAVVFGAGLAVGDARGVQRGHALALAAFDARSDATQEEIALLVQRTGSAYVRALVSLGLGHDALSADAATSQGTAAAMTITEAALIELAPLLNEPEQRVRLIDRLLSGYGVANGNTTRWY
jgi:RNA polymerase sigma factor (sigma-70 family)